MIAITTTFVILILFTVYLIYFSSTTAEKKPNKNYGESTFIIQTGGYY